MTALGDSICIVCTTCLVLKAAEQFPKRSAGKHGRRSKCKACHNAKRMEWVSTNRDQVRENGREAAAKRRATPEGRILHNEASKRYYERNRVRALVAAGKYRFANKAKVVAGIRAWRHAHPDAAKAANARWNSSNLAARRAYGQNRRARMRSSGQSISSDIAPKLFALQRGMCPCCALPLGDDYHLDHKMPLALGGSNTDDNMQLLRAKCNLQKNAKHPVDFMQSRGFLL